MNTTLTDTPDEYHLFCPYKKCSWEVFDFRETAVERLSSHFSRTHPESYGSRCPNCGIVHPASVGTVCGKRKERKRMDYDVVVNIPGKGVPVELRVRYAQDQTEAARIAVQRVRRDMGVTPRVEYIAEVPGTERAVGS